MDTNFQALPPLKRFRLLQQQQEEKQETQENNATVATSNLHLPAKKRKQSRDPLLVPQPTTTTYSLPAKKRVWAFQPDECNHNNNDDKPLSPIDLNIEYKPSFDEDRETPLANEEEIQEDNDDADDDGIVCAVCQSTDGDPMDPIVFCDGCDLMVHATCYGDPLVKGVPDGDWFCKQCSFSPSNKNMGFSCCLCPIKGGAMKPTNDGRWAHIVCSLLVPEVFFGDPEGREEIDCSSVPKWRWERECYVCKSGSNGCVIDCSEPKCGLAFHVTCGLREDLCIEYKEGRKKGAVVAGFCKDHTELWKKQQQTGKFKIVAREENKK